MRYLAIDLGDKRTGIAVGDAITRMAVPVGVIEIPIGDRAGSALLEAIDHSIREHIGDTLRTPGELVLGLPLNMDGSDGQRARMVREFATTLRARTGRAVHLQDERLTSAQADWTMARSGLTHKQKKLRRDALAAATLLADFLSALPSRARDDLDPDRY